jgi:hypothetical protein
MPPKPQDYSELIAKLSDALETHFDLVYTEKINTFDINYFLNHYDTMYQLVCYYEEQLNNTFQVIKERMTVLYLKYNTDRIHDKSIDALLQQHTFADNLKATLKIIFHPFIKIREVEKHVHIQDIEIIINDIINLNFVRNNFEHYDEEVYNLMLGLIDSCKTNDFSQSRNDFKTSDKYFSETQKEIFGKIVQIIQIITIYETKFVDRLVSKWKKIPIPITKNLETILQNSLAHNYVMFQLSECIPTLPKNGTILKRVENYSTTIFEDLQESIILLDISKTKYLHEMMNLCYSFGLIQYPEHIDLIMKNHILHHVKFCVISFPHDNFMHHFIEFTTRFHIFINNCDTIFLITKNNLYSIINEPWFTTHLSVINSDVPSKDLNTYFMMSWLNDIYKMDVVEFNEHISTYFEFFAQVKEKDVLLENFVLSCEKRFIHFRYDVSKDELVALYLENKLGSHHLVYKFCTMIKDIRRSEEMFSGNGYVLTSSMWSEPKKESITLNPRVQELLDLYEMLYTSSFDSRRVEWDKFHSLASITIADKEVILPLLAANTLLYIEELETKDLQHLSIHYSNPSHMQFWIDYLRKNSLVDTTGDEIKLTFEKFLEKQKQDTIILTVPSATKYFKFIKTPIAAPTRSVVEERPEVVQAHVVKIMKAAKKLPLPELFGKTKDSVTLFPVTEEMFKKQIDYLIRQDYLEEAESDILAYVP